MARAERSTPEIVAGRLAERTGYSFRDQKLMMRALTHASARSSGDLDNERLEFLGDRVLGLIVAELLFRLYPDAPEGELSVRFNALVSGAACAEIAEELNLVDLIQSAGIKTLTGRKAKGVRADVMEALIAAVYMDGGIDAAREFITRHWRSRAESARRIWRDPKTELQGWAHQVSGEAPEYIVDSREGPDHAPVFSVTVRVKGRAPEEGRGRTKREAEQAAASAVLLREGVWTAADLAP